MERRNAGFTLIEALIGMLVLGVLLVIAVPAWSTAMARSHAASARASLLESLMHAVRHASITGTEVVLCPGNAHGCVDTNDWSGGWIAYADIDGDRLRDDVEPLVHAESALGGGVHLRTTRGRKRLVFHPNGGNTGSNATFTLCDGRGPEQAVTLVLANGGRLRAGKPTSRAARDCTAPPA